MQKAKATLSYTGYIRSLRPALSQKRKKKKKELAFL